MERAAIDQWETYRKIGKNKYILWYWAVRYGVGLAVILTLVELVTQKGINTTWVFIRILVFPIIASLVGNVKWTQNEALYSKAEQLKHERIIGDSSDH